MTEHARYEWNTGRHYTPEGQRIVAEVGEDLVSFYDYSRGIYGTMPRSRWNPLTDLDAVRSYVMANYDGNKYDSGQQAYAFFLRLVCPTA